MTFNIENGNSLNQLAEILMGYKNTYAFLLHLQSFALA